MAKTSERPCIAYQRDLPLPPLPKKGFLMSCITRCKPENRAPNSQVLGSTCTPVSCSLHLPLPSPPLLQQVAISHYPRLKRLQGVAASASSSLTNNTPTTRTTTAAQLSTQGVAPLGGTQACPSHFCTFLQMGLHLRSPPPQSTTWLHLPAASKSYIRYMKTFFKSSTKNKIKKIFIEVPRWLLHCGSSGCVGHREVRRAPLKFWSHQTGRRSHPGHTD